MIFELAIFIILIILILINCIPKYSHKESSKIKECNGAPFVGFLYNFRPGGDYQRKMVELKQKHGSICYVKMGSYMSLWLNDYKIIREAWSNSIFCGRPKLPGITNRTHGFSGGIIFNEGKDFTEQRRFTVKHLKEFGLGKISMEEIILEEINEIMQKLKESINEIPISTRHLFNVASLNILWAITTGKQYKHDDKELLGLLEVLTRNMELKGGTMLAFFMPWISKWFPNLSGWKTYLKDANKVFDFWKNYAHQRINSFDSSEIPNNFVDLYIKQIKECQDPYSSFFEKNGELSLATTLQDLFIAGSETSSITLSWMFLYAAVFILYQEEVHEEISLIIGNQVPSLMNRRKMPKAEAFIMETMRFGTLAPLGMIHCTQEATQLAGFNIPKGTLLHANLYAAHNDNEAWKDPDRFDPHRFLSDDKTIIIRNEAFLAFSSGKRGCPGEALARNELFLFLVTILQKYRVSLSPDSYNIDLSPNMGVSATPKPHKLIFKLRKKYENK